MPRVLLAIMAGLDPAIQAGLQRRAPQRKQSFAVAVGWPGQPGHDVEGAPPGDH